MCRCQVLETSLRSIRLVQLLQCSSSYPARPGRGRTRLCRTRHRKIARISDELSAGLDRPPPQQVPGRRLLREPAPAAARAWCSARRGAPAAGCFHHHRRLMHIMVAAPCASGVSGASGVCCCSCRWANRHERTRRVDHRLTSVSPATTPGLDTTIACADTRFRYGSSQRSQRTSLLPCRVTVRPVVACPADVSLLSSDLHALIMP